MQGGNNMEEEATLLHLMQFTCGTVASMTMKAMLDLDIFGIMGSFGPSAMISATQIASRLPRQHPNTCNVLEQMLKLMASHSFLTTTSNETGELLYSLAPASRYFSNDVTRGTLAYFHQISNNYSILDACIHMKDEILDGREAKKRNLYDPINMEDECRTVLLNAMAGIGAFLVHKVLREYKGFESISLLVDVGGGNGEFVSNVVRMYPTIKGINFDLPEAVKLAPNRPGVEHVAGDMFKCIPKADALILKEVLHNWDDNQCLTILKNCLDALPSERKVIVIGFTTLEVPDLSHASQIVANVNLRMALLFSGKGRTHNQLYELGRKAGFAKCHFACTAYAVWTVLEFIK